ncbi:membrane protein involved in the export of O-antigen and teichoic acid [Prevotella dentalis DSM 3688]|uniref:Membrane protein involved in the export of O-antigen and teichoic acid n=1 Tax=Prevotella dentalis (strain ATCC 49559 / DSM 3688 / JCM 13448 / NCTC 12043 / ES 2772) TaxID=908937 RepID=F9D3G0_PREDD|nr:lipopolysaccharide biosynthesis protein [Prevotella dentalis]AGB27409.1 membrane protein involved in the export of O-antigen and teichoic acid [Prevotella dentalis DSM 3688]EGQ14711.1 polysaccharide biosynthesis protein [Prevotella dentalis DSM 3688]
MANLKSLLKDTAIYGISSIAGRFINYLLVPIQTAAWAASGGQYGVVTNVYAYTALLLVVLTYGMETTFFRYANKTEENPQTVYTTTLLAVGSTSLLFILLVLGFLGPIASFMGYADHPDWVAVMFVCVAVDAFKCIPFAYLRYKKRPVKFACIQLANILLNVVLNITYLFILPRLHLNPFGLYDEHFTLDVGMVFYINLVCTGLVTLMFWRELTEVPYRFDARLLRRMLRYAWPLLILGIAGILNQTFDKIVFPFLYRGADARAELSIYGATVKIAMIMAMITQAFRYAYEPFVFGKAKDKDNRETYAKAMKYFIIFTLLAFLLVVGYMDVLRYIIRNHDYWAGLRVVPICMAAEIMMGVYFNLSFWYKLTDRTIWGAWFSGAGCLVLIAVNVVFVPQYSYMACAWGGFAGYGTAMLLSYFVGQRYYPINYPVRQIMAYVLLALVLFAGMTAANARLGMLSALAVNTVLVAIFVGYAVRRDFPLASLPVIGRHFRH